MGQTVCAVLYHSCPLLHKCMSHKDTGNCEGRAARMWCNFYLSVSVCLYRDNTAMACISATSVGVIIKLDDCSVHSLLQLNNCCQYWGTTDCQNETGVDKKHEDE